MFLSLCISVFLILGAPLRSPGPRKHGKQEQQISSSVNQYTHNNHNYAKQPMPLVGSTAPPAKGDGENRGAQPDDPSLPYWVAGFTAALAGIAFMQLLVFIFQACAMSKQAQYMRKGLRISMRLARDSKHAADAAIKNAEAFMNSERAWLTVSIRGIERGVIKAGNGLAEISFSNYGKSPAKITQVLTRVDKVHSVKELDRLRLEDGQPLPGVENTLVGLAEPLRKAYDIPANKLMGWDPSYPEIIFVWGVVYYTDIYNRPWHTKFLYKCTPQQLRSPILVERVANARYNEHGAGDCKEGASDLGQT